MKTEKIALTLYVISSILAIFAVMLGYDRIRLFANPVVIPSIFFYYLAVNEKKVNMLFVVVLVLSFIGDTVNFLEFENIILYLMIPYFITYLILLKFAFEDLKKVPYQKKGAVASFLFFLSLMFLLYHLVSLFADANGELVIPVIIYGVFLATYGTIAVYCYYVKKTTANYYLFIVALLSIFSDVFYVMFSLIFHMENIKYFEFSAQLISYFFMVKYFILREEIEEKIEFKLED